MAAVQVNPELHQVVRKMKINTKSGMNLSQAVLTQEEKDAVSKTFSKASAQLVGPTTTWA